MSEILGILRDRAVSGEPVRTPAQRKPNWIRRVDNEAVWVETERSKGDPQSVPIAWLREAVEMLLDQGWVGHKSLTAPATHRSVFLIAALGELAITETTIRPTVVRLS